MLFGMRTLALLFILLGVPAHAWTFSPLPICTLALEGEEDVAVTYDAAKSEYAIAITRDGGWPTGPVFALRFDGPVPRTITTDRHVITGNTLTVRDRGFGNVLKGMQGNFVATATIGNLAVAFTLAGANKAVPEFEACAQALAV